MYQVKLTNVGDFGYHSVYSN